MVDTGALEVAPNAVAAPKGGPTEGIKGAGKVGGGLTGSSKSVETGDAVSKDSANSAPLWMPVDKGAKLQVHRPSARSGKARVVGTRRHHGCKPAWLRGRGPGGLGPEAALWPLLAIIGLYWAMAGLGAYGSIILDMLPSLGCCGWCGQRASIRYWGSRVVNTQQAIQASVQGGWLKARL